ncbi:FecR domain-containing protein [Methylophaga sp. OBS4]|uniref:FecR domain-containing protein n=1 Tax=Methylophaga sp. OBS4 TaxID=2991935 RepID=UPI002254553A|nr:FecR family protein [Methylophaga sp. OBS4]MCX4187974.1 FecR family protein [Methylophaga sp. OBS4]
MSQTKSLNELEPEVMEQAVDWLVRLNADDVGEEDRRAFERWRQACPDHAAAWARAELLMRKLGKLPASLAMPALGRHVDKKRRAALNKLLMVLLVAPVGWGSWRFANSQGWSADYHTASGESRDLQLADGTKMTLNTATAVDIHFDSQHRVVRLHRGEILIETGQDPGDAHRPFLVVSAQGRMEALGTRFNVRQYPGKTELTVLEGAVRIEPGQAGAENNIVLSAGQQAVFTEDAVGDVKPAGQAATAWTRGMLLADNIRLGDFVTELSRYRSGLLRCDPAIADLRISGAYPVSDPEKSLNMLVSTYPVALASRMGGFWVTLLPR